MLAAVPPLHWLARRLKAVLRYAVPPPPAPAAPSPMQFLPGSASLRLYASHAACNIARARDELGYRPAYDFKAGMEHVAAYLRWNNGVDTADEIRARSPP
jgi:nucleoside-diphosphate-sugar epimerase